MDEKYRGIIDLPHRDPSAKHPRMTMQNRAAQFAPFAALKGYEEAIGETARFTDAPPLLSDDAKERIDRRLRLLEERAAEHPTVTVTFFRPDEIKSGGLCVTFSDRAASVDRKKRVVRFLCRPPVDVDRLLDLTGDLFENNEI